MPSFGVRGPPSDGEHAYPRGLAAPTATSRLWPKLGKATQLRSSPLRSAATSEKRLYLVMPPQVPKSNNQESLNLVNEILHALSASINSLGGKDSAKPADKYLFFAARHIFECIDAYVILRKYAKNYPAKIVIRSALEMMFRFEAVRKKPALLYRISFSENDEDKKLTRPFVNDQNDIDYASEVAGQLEKVKPDFQLAFPGEELVDNGLTVFDAAKEGGHENEYETYYRYYCRFTHGGLRAINRTLDEFDHFDDPTMALLGLVTTTGLKDLGAIIPDCSDLDRRLGTLLADR